MRNVPSVDNGNEKNRSRKIGGSFSPSLWVRRYKRLCHIHLYYGR